MEISDKISGPVILLLSILISVFRLYRKRGKNKIICEFSDMYLKNFSDRWADYLCRLLNLICDSALNVQKAINCSGSLEALRYSWILPGVKQGNSR